MSKARPTSIISHWNHMVPGMQHSSNEFYGVIDRILKGEHLDEARCERVNIAEGGIFSSKREYLQVRRKAHVFHICAAPFGTGFFVSWWLGEVRSGLWAALASLPFVGGFFGFLADVAKPTTYYKVDTALMFQAITHGAVLEALDNAIDAKGMRALTELEKKPVMRDFFGQLSGGR